MEHVFGGKFKPGKKIGSGSFGELYLGVNIQSSEQYQIIAKMWYIFLQLDVITHEWVTHARWSHCCRST